MCLDVEPKLSMNRPGAYPGFTTSNVEITKPVTMKSPRPAA